MAGVNNLIETIIIIWPELPDLVGDNEWPRFRRRCAELLEQRVTEPDQAAIIDAELVSLFSQNQAAHSRLVEALHEDRDESAVAKAYRGLAGDPIQPPPRPPLHCPATDPPHELDWTDIDYSDPDRLTCRRHPGTELVRV